MASSASIVANANLASGNSPNPLSVQSGGSGKNTMKLSSKGSEGGRRPSPADATSRRATPQKPWTPGTNPLSLRNATPTQQNGNISQQKPSNQAKSNSQKEAALTDRHANERFKFILTAATGITAHVTTKTGDKFEGAVSSSYSQASSFILSLKMTRKASDSNSSTHNGIVSHATALVGHAPEYAMDFDLRDVAEISISDLKIPEQAVTQNGTVPKFQTDTDISGKRLMRERELQPWVPETDVSLDMSLESAGSTQWDQFETNERLFGAKNTYDESHYTTQIDRSAPTYKSREEHAQKVAQEIEGKVGENAHMREERGQALQDDGDGDDEEDKYSGVRREAASNYLPLSSGAPNKYTPPARRPPSSQPTVAGAPVDPAIISSQLSRPDGVRVAVPKTTPKVPEVKIEDIRGSPVVAETPSQNSIAGVEAEAKGSGPSTDSSQPTGEETQSMSINPSASPQQSVTSENQTEGVENRVLEHFRKFATSEKLRVNERKRAQASHDRTARLNDLKRFSTNFKLKTPIPVDLVGILAKDPAKQEQIMEKARKETDESTTPVTAGQESSSDTSTTTRASVPTVTKFDPSTIPPPLVDRQTFLSQKNRDRFPVQSGRGDRANQQTGFAGRGAPTFSQRPAAVNLDRKQLPSQSIPAPIPLPEPRMPPSGPMADQSNVSSPQRSALHTPTSAVSTKFNVKALEFRPSINAPTFNPTSSSNAPSSPAASVQRTRSISRTASPSAFFGNRKPLSPDARPSIGDYFNPIKRMKLEEEQRKAQKESGKEGEVPKDKKDFSSNGGIPYAFMTGPRWTVKAENAEKGYILFFEKPQPQVASPHQSRLNSNHHIPYHQQVPQHLQNGQHAIPQISTPQFTAQQHVQVPQYPHYDESHRMSMPIPNNTQQMYTSPRLQPGQMGYPSPMGHPAQLAYGQVQYFGGQPGQAPMQMRQFSNQQFMHSPATQAVAPVMMPQPSAGSYMTVPAQFQQMPMHSPGAQYAFPQQNGYPSPGRVAPMMSHQGSQHSHHGGQPMMYTMSGQQGQMSGYGQQGQMGGMRPGYNAQGPYGSSPMQPHHFNQRTMSSGYGAKMMQMPQNHGPPMNAPQQPSAYGQGDA